MNLTRIVWLACIIASLLLTTGLPVIAGNPEGKSEAEVSSIAADIRQTAKAHYEAGRYEEAVEAFRRAAAAEPSDAAIWIDIGLVRLAQKDHDRAVLAFRKALEVDPGNAQARLNLGVLAMDRNDPQAAESEFKRAVALRPEWPEARTNLGGLYLKEGKRDEAMREFQAALKEDPKFLVALYNIATLYKQSQDWKLAEETYRRILQINPRAPMAHLEVAAIYTNRLEQPAKAIYHYQRFLDLSPPGPMREKVRRSIQNIGGAESSAE